MAANFGVLIISTLSRINVFIYEIIYMLRFLVFWYLHYSCWIILFLHICWFYLLAWSFSEFIVLFIILLLISALLITILITELTINKNINTMQSKVYEICIIYKLSTFMIVHCSSPILYSTYKQTFIHSFIRLRTYSLLCTLKCWSVGCFYCCPKVCIIAEHYTISSTHT